MKDDATKRSALESLGVVAAVLVFVVAATMHLGAIFGYCDRYSAMFSEAFATMTIVFSVWSRTLRPQSAKDGPCPTCGRRS